MNELLFELADVIGRDCRLHNRQARRMAFWIIQRAKAEGISEATVRNVFVTGVGTPPSKIQGCRCPSCIPSREIDATADM
jgi:hypothetical protein